MKKINRSIVFVLALVFMLAMSTSALANSNEAFGGSYDFDGEDIVTEDAASITDAISELEPGDDVTIKLQYSNSSDDVTEWYMKNDIIKSLEDSSAASGGGYTYKLSNFGPDGAETVIFSSDAVGGVSTEGGTGLHQADNATEEWFFIQELDQGESGETELYVAFDGESQVNSYQDTAAELTVSYAVEKLSEPDTIYKHVKVKTGDDSKLMLALVTFLGALILLVLAFISRRNDRKDGAADEN